MIPGTPNIPTMHAFKTFKGIHIPNPFPTTLIITSKAPPIRLLMASFAATLSGK